jgi:folate-binding protein YgfZ
MKRGEAPELATQDMLAVPLPSGDKWLAVATDATAPDFSQDRADTWKAEELKAGISWLNTESSGQFLPQMLGFDDLGAVNFRKGCYPGQEIVARTHYLGKVKRHPRILITDMAECPDPLEKIHISGIDQHKYEAVVADCVIDGDSGNLIFVVTRMDPELKAVAIEHKGQSFKLQ